MTRATPLPPAERREAILDAVIPLVLDEGRSVRTRQIAEASGIAEGTIYKVFASKDELIDEAIQRALAPDALFSGLAALPAATELDQTTEQLVGYLQSHVQLTHRLMALLPRTGDNEHGHDKAGHRDTGARLVAAIAEALEPHSAQLRVPTAAAAQTILALSFGSAFSRTTSEPPHVVGVLLHGICTPEGTACS